MLSTRAHPRILLCPASLVLVGLITAALLSIVISGNGYALYTIWLAWVLLMLWMVLKTAYWLTTWYAVTSYRLLRAKGLFFRKIWMMPLKRITDMAVQQSAKAHHFDYGKLVMTIDQRLSREWSIEFAPHPDKIYAAMRKVLFPDWDIGGD